MVTGAGSEELGGTEITVNAGSRVVVGDGVTIVSGTDRLAPGGITILPQSILWIEDNVGTWGGGAFSFGGLTSQTKATVTTNVDVGNGVTLSTRGDLAIGTATDVKATNKVVGISAVATASVSFNATSDVAVNQQITFGTNSKLAADNAMTITAGADPAAVAPTGISVASIVVGETYGAFTFIDVVAKPSLAHTSTVTFGTGAAVGSGGNMRIAAEKGLPTVKGDGQVT